MNQKMLSPRMEHCCHWTVSGVMERVAGSHIFLQTNVIIITEIFKYILLVSLGTILRLHSKPTMVSHSQPGLRGGVLVGRRPTELKYSVVP